MRSKKRVSAILLAVLLALITCCSCTAWGGKRLLNWISFETAWRVVNDRHFDPTFGGVEWPELRAHYRRQVAFAGDADYYRLVNEMLWELDVSHLAVVPLYYWPLAEPAALAEGSTGLDVRLLDGEVVITSVRPGSPADKARLRPGFVIQNIDGSTIEQIATQAELGMDPPDNGRHRIEAITSDVLARIYGPPGTDVTLVYLDGQGKLLQSSIERVGRPGKTMTLPGFPSGYVEFESRRLDGGIGYVHFNWFDKALARKLSRAISSMPDARGLIIDLRGNPGGMRDAAIAGAEQLVSDRVKCSTLRRRDGIRDIILDPTHDGYDGPVVVLIDVMSKSSSEFFAACTQAIGRSVVIGERSPGSIGPAELMLLPNGATLIYPVAQETTLDGTILEDHGVIPDIEVALDRALLSRGIDSQLEAASSYIEQELLESERARLSRIPQTQHRD
ncbi:S41 family peptidase [Chloroflexota bacterium]